LSDIYGKCLDEHSEFADKENAVREPWDTKIDQSSEGRLFDLGRTSQARRRTVSIPEDEVCGPVSIVTVFFRCHTFCNNLIIFCCCQVS
jgi:hypothetical protein